MRGSLLRSNVYAVIKKRRQDAIARFNEKLEKLCENPEFNDAYLAERSAELALVRAKHMDKGVKQATDELARVQGATDKVLKKLGLTRDDLTVNYFCPQCSDTGVVDGKPCICVEVLFSQLAHEGRQATPLHTFEESNAKDDNEKVVNRLKKWCENLYISKLCLNFAMSS